MHDIIIEETGLPLKFPDPAEEAYARAQEFRRLSSDVRFQQIASMMAWGLQQVQLSKRRATTEQRWNAEESAWQEMQQELIQRYGK
jgi:hypothetical protein